MKLTLTAFLVAAAASPVFGQECTFPQRTPVEQNGQMQYRFTNGCGEAYEVGYRLEGKTLHFPRGGKHSLPEASEAEAERTFRETYGLLGEPEALIRTGGF